MEYVLQIVVPQLYGTPTKITKICSTTNVSYFGVITNTETLFEISRQESNVTISTKLAETCKVLVARRISPDYYTLIVPCVYNPNDISIFRDNGQTLSIQTPDGKTLFLAIDQSSKPTCQSPHLVFVQNESNNIIKCSQAQLMLKEKIIPLPPIVPESTGLSAGYIVLIILLSILGLAVIIRAIIYIAQNTGKRPFHTGKNVRGVDIPGLGELKPVNK